MATTYVINYTDEINTGKTPIVVLPGQVDNTHTSINLCGQGLLTYGENINENLLHMLENFASPNPPSASVRTIGQLWFDYGENALKVLNKDNQWVTTSGLSVFTFSVLSANGVSQSFVISGNQTATLANGTQFAVSGTPGGVNDGVYTVATTAYNSGANETTVVVNEPVTTQTIGGSMTYTPNPTTPYLGQLWYDTTTSQLFMWDGTQWVALILSSGTAPMSGNLNMNNLYTLTNLPDPINLTDAANKNYVDNSLANKITKSGDTNIGPLVFANDAAVVPDIKMLAEGLVAAETNLHFNIDSTNTGTAVFAVHKGGETSAATTLFTVDTTGVATLTTANYETLVTANNHVPNKKYVDDAISTAVGGAGATLPVINPTTPKDGDIKVAAGPVISMYAAGAWRQIFPAVYS